jgi:anti-sigma factor ChrR (cupin superfamily)
MSLIPSCPEVRANFTEYLEGTLPWHKRLGIRFHLLICDACEALLKGLRALPFLSRNLLEAPAEPAPEAARALEGALKHLHTARPGEDVH